jgi:hypothetical protein
MKTKLETDQLAKDIEAAHSETPFRLKLETDERVLARVTDGIYRQPTSAFRELISNAYDADATRVVIQTDAPRFSIISIEDNGLGMSPKVLAHLLTHIGGSAKKASGEDTLGITDPGDTTRSPGGRKLIGKVGIGLFSVSQLTQHFLIITKVKGDPFRTVASIALRQFGEEIGPDGNFESGKVLVWREKASDVDSQGTRLVLDRIKPATQKILQSEEMWLSTEPLEGDELPELEPPKFHIGRQSQGNLVKEAVLPWDDTDKADVAFRKLVNSIWAEVKPGKPNPKLEKVFDFYLQMVWLLSLSAPLDYTERDIFGERPGTIGETYLLSNDPKGKAEKIEDDGRSLSDVVGVERPVEKLPHIEIFFDNLKLSRPILFRELPDDRKPLVFVGKFRQDFLKHDRSLSAGPVAFHAYLFWSPKIAPTEHRGSLIRIHGSSGTLFDSSFMRYQVAEQTRLSQIVCEIFVTEGLDSALNIDRESFNTSHPHYVVVSKWLREALRQLSSTQKRLASGLRLESQQTETQEQIQALTQIADDVWKCENVGSLSEPPVVELSDASPLELDTLPISTYQFPRDSVTGNLSDGRKTKQKQARREVLEARLMAITQILVAFGLLETLPKKRQEALLKALYKVLEYGEQA